MDTIDQTGSWLLRAKTIEFLLVLIVLVPVLIFILLKFFRDLIGLPFGRIPSTFVKQDDVKLIKSLLAQSRNFVAISEREAVARLFVSNGIYFIKGPFRSPVNFTDDELKRMPTNAELGNARLKENA
jgi:hypothetical protein